MKNQLTTLLLCLLFIPGFCQNSNFKYEGRMTISVKKEKVDGAQFVSDLTPELWHMLGLPVKEREELEYRRRMGYPLGYYVYPEGGYEAVVDYDSVEISAQRNGKLLSASGASGQLTAEQKNILNTTDLGTDVRIKIKFNYKNETSNNNGDKEIKEGGLVVTVVPEKEAEYPGGNKQLTDYMVQNIFNKFSGRDIQRVQNVVVNFVINEEGQVVDAKIVRFSTDPQIDKFILNIINKMPAWKPAENSKGIKVKEKFSIPLGGGGC
jgi:protein TonB